jgi:hypothetical protein
MFINNPTNSDGRAIARLGHILCLISYLISLPLSDIPKSNKNNFKDFS